MNSNEDRTNADSINDMLADLELDQSSEDRLRSALTDVRAQAAKVPVASADVVALLKGATPLRRGNRRLAIVAAAGALTLGGASAAAASNRLPDSLQEVVANVTDGLPVRAPHPTDHPKPVKPTNAPSDAPGQLKDKSHKDSDDSDKSKHDNSDAPGQIQKATKPDPQDPGPAKPADPGSHGRARAAEVQADQADHTDRGKHGRFGIKPDKPAKSHGGSGHSHGQDNDDN